LLAELQVSGSTSTTNFFLTDALGSVLGVYSNMAGSASFLSNQVYSPYGTQLSANGNNFSQYTSKGFTGQYNDPTSGLDYYVSRYYDPVSGVFLSADKKIGNPQGTSPYDYVDGNPETYIDPSGQAYIPPGPGSGNNNTNNNNNTTGNNSNNTNSSGSGCAWWNPFCVVPQVWHTIVSDTKTIEKDVQTSWNDSVRLLQQGEQEIVEEGIKLVVKIIVAIVAAVISFGIFLFGALRNSRTPEQEARRIEKAARAKWQDQEPALRNKSDYGGAYLIISGPKKKYQPYRSVFIAFGSPHVEQLAIDWALEKIAEYQAQWGSISSVNLLIYTFKTPCAGSCAPNLRDGVWLRQLQQAAGGSAVVQINVWTSNGSQSGHRNVVPWT
jgi:RHS repeat-associated protein